MTKFFFDVIQGDLLDHDAEGRDLPDFGRARSEALRLLGQAAATGGANRTNLALQLRDERRALLARMTVEVFEPLAEPIRPPPPTEAQIALEQQGANDIAGWIDDTRGEIRGLRSLGAQSGPAERVLRSVIHTLAERLAERIRRAAAGASASTDSELRFEVVRAGGSTYSVVDRLSKLPAGEKPRRLLELGLDDAEEVAERLNLREYLRGQTNRKSGTA